MAAVAAIMYVRMHDEIKLRIVFPPIPHSIKHTANEISLILPGYLDAL